jgi:hypothetical protein
MITRRITRRVIVPAILTLSTAGSIVAGTATSITATSASSAVVASAPAHSPDYLYRG